MKYLRLFFLFLVLSLSLSCSSDTNKIHDDDIIILTDLDQDNDIVSDEDFLSDDDTSDEDIDDPWNNEDADGDGIPNGIEGKEDTDGDETPNYLDLDSDGDGIPDSVEAGKNPLKPVDSDYDGEPDFKDPDSDSDSIPDSEEAGETPKNPMDTDGDGIPDYIDKDSDNDGIWDKMEVQKYNTDPRMKDTDGDGDDDLSELAFETDPTDPEDHTPYGQIHVFLIYDAADSTKRTVKFGIDTDKIDVAIALDRSGSLKNSIDNLKSGLKDIVIDGIRNYWENSGEDNSVAFGLMSFGVNMEFLEGSGEFVYNIDQMIKTVKSDEDAALIKESVDSLEADADDERHSEPLYQLATGEGLQSALDSKYAVNSSWDIESITLDIPKADCKNYEGDIGGICFRENALPIVILITDETVVEIPSHDATLDYDVGFRWSEDYPEGHTLSDAAEALSGIEAKFIGIYRTPADSDDNADDPEVITNELFTPLAEATYSLNSETGKPFVYGVNSDGSDLAETIVDAVKELTSYTVRDVKTEVRSDAVCEGYNSNVSATQFIKSIKIIKVEKEDGGYPGAVMGNFFGNHDQERALTEAGNNYARLRLAQTYLMTAPINVPMLYQGDDIGMVNTQNGYDSGRRNNMKFTNLTTEEQTSLNHIKKLGNFRDTHPALRYGTRTTCSVTDSAWIYKLTYNGKTVIVGLNRGDSSYNGTCSGVSGTFTDLDGNSTSFSGSVTVPANGSIVMGN